MTLVLQYFSRYGRRIARDGQAIGPRGQGRPWYTTSGSVTSSWLASSVKVRVLQLFTALRRAVGVRGRRNCTPPTCPPPSNRLRIRRVLHCSCTPCANVSYSYITNFAKVPVGHTASGGHPWRGADADSQWATAREVCGSGARSANSRPVGLNLGIPLKQMFMSLKPMYE